MKRTIPPRFQCSDMAGAILAASLLFLVLLGLNSHDNSVLSTRLLAAEEQRGAAEGKSDPAYKEQRKEELEEMRRRAQNTKAWQVRGADKIPAELVPEPVLRFDSQFHGCTDATLWLYGAKGRPVAMQAVECYRRPGHPKYFYCLTSLSDGLVEAQWLGGREWSSTKPGIELRVLPDAPTPASTEAARMRQMREAIRRFSATRVDFFNIREENRVLAQALHRYRDPDSGLQDGALFAFVANGTSPDFLLFLELRGKDLPHATWNYGVHRTTTGELHLRLDDKEVWTVPLQSNPGRDVYDTWLFFFAVRQEMGR